MTRRRALTRTLFFRLLSAAPPRRRDHAAAMAAEFDHIPDDVAARSHAVGCSFFIAKEILMTTQLQSVLRWGLIATACLWAAAKATILFQVSSSDPLAMTPAFFGYNALVGALYLAAAWLAGRRRYAAAVLAFCGVSLCFASQFALAAWVNYESHHFSLAVAGEDVIVWTTIMLGAAGFWLLGRRGDNQITV